MTSKQKQKEESMILEGIVVEAVRGSFRVEIVDQGKNADPTKPGPVVLAHLGGKIRKHNIRIVQGDRVEVEVSPYDFTRGRITYRIK